MASLLHRSRASLPSAPTLLSRWFPHVQLPLVISAPMFNASNGILAAAVSRAGGLGIVPGGWELAPGGVHLKNLDAELRAARKALDLDDKPLTPMPVAAGLVLCKADAARRFEEGVLPLLVEHSPQGVWLFAPDPDVEAEAQREGAPTPGSLRSIIGLLHHAGFVVMVQVGSVAAAREAATYGADVIVAQGIDAGGHQLARTASVVSLVPEVKTMLETDFPEKEIALVAAGGIVDGRGVAAALVLGAEGAVLGTRFLLSKEATTHAYQRKVVAETADGGLSTIKSTVHDQVRGTTVWPALYDGRAVVGTSYSEYSSGVPVEELQKRLKEGQERGDHSRMVTWAGTGVGLVNEELPAGDIVREVREAAKKRIKEVQNLV
ncbi:hypothetical protein VTK73DRAFT_1535 [Phialemonium thermophilum]|uniref:Nitronate monooxygenase domain-containing protein n=1 Tax=Phialemonium thermophilum TaxID=223376 RepID=A0ABR3VTB9_9PEZI